jgi:hypothetical protein
MIKRYLEGPILEALEDFPAVLLTGARQVGKSTLARSLIRDSWPAVYLTFDQRLVLDAALRDPDGWVASLPRPVIIDEVQRAPEVLRSIKQRIDRDRQPGQYLLTGSANLMTLSTVSESLAGRIALFALYPFCWAELLGKPYPAVLQNLFSLEKVSDLIKLVPVAEAKESSRLEILGQIVKGGYPPATIIKSRSSRSRWFTSYRQTYLEKDLLQIKAIEHLPDFNRLMPLAAFRTGKLLNYSDFSRDAGLPFSTLRRYINLLEVTYQIFLLRPYFSNRSQRLIKTPKIYYLDTGMAAHLMALDNSPSLESNPLIGSLVETWIATELIKLLSALIPGFSLYFWRTRTGKEVDFIIERGDRLIAVEVKWGQSLSDSDLSGLNQCQADFKEKLAFSIILYGGTETVPLGPRLAAVPFQQFLGTAF